MSQKHAFDTVQTGTWTKRTRYIVVDTAVLPEIFGKVLEVKKLVADKTERSFSSACKRMGISRSAFYKYRDCVFAYDDKMTQQIVNFSVTLRDEAGVLSNVLTTLYSMRANILTVNQNIPVDGVAQVSLSLKMGEGMANPIDITHKISACRRCRSATPVRRINGGFSKSAETWRK